MARKGSITMSTTVLRIALRIFICTSVGGHYLQQRFPAWLARNATSAACEIASAGVRSSPRHRESALVSPCSRWRGRLVAVVLLCVLATAGCAGGDDSSDREDRPKGLSLAIIGDTPYGSEQVAGFRGDIEAINDDPEVTRVIHLGDIQEGSSRCTDRYLARIRRDFDAFEDPLIYTPGDNEWTDCHRASKGALVPTERLSELRSVFFDRPGRSLGGAPAKVASQRRPFVENVRWTQGRAVFTTLHVPGSNNDLEPWFEASAPGPAQRAEHRSRLRADLEWLDQAFDAASAQGAAGVVVAMQADMWPPSVAGIETSGYEAIIAKLAARARAFDRPVLVLQGDSHVYRFDRPLLDATPPVPNLIRLVVQGADSSPREWLRLNVAPSTREVFTWDRVPLDE